MYFGELTDSSSNTTELFPTGTVKIFTVLICMHLQSFGPSKN